MTDIHHDSAAILIEQLNVKDEEISLLRSRMGAIEYWITDVKTLADPKAMRIALAMEACLLPDMSGEVIPGIISSNDRMLRALNAIDRHNDTMKNHKDGNVRRTVNAIDQIIEEAL